MNNISMQAPPSPFVSSEVEKRVPRVRFTFLDYAPTDRNRETKPQPARQLACPARPRSLTVHA
ncbi:hypothetical protein SPHINGOAX6_70387 [Sphingomonas sp. AX6]|nr:hypothetical protein SPHINGOAX6_70387 [Sphingomonas sp. AX6]